MWVLWFSCFAPCPPRRRRSMAKPASSACASPADTTLARARLRLLPPWTSLAHASITSSAGLLANGPSDSQAAPAPVGSGPASDACGRRTPSAHFHDIRPANVERGAPPVAPLGRGLPLLADTPGSVGRGRGNVLMSLRLAHALDCSMSKPSKEEGVVCRPLRRSRRSAGRGGHYRFPAPHQAPKLGATTARAVPQFLLTLLSWQL